MDMSGVISQMGILFLTAGLGFIGAKAHCMDEKSNTMLSKIVLNLMLPCTVIASVYSGERSLSNAQVGLLALSSCVCSAVLILIAKGLMALLRVPKEHKGVCEFLVLFTNVGFIGYPVLRTIFGEVSVFYAAVISMVHTLLSYSYGVYLIRGKTGKSSFTVKDVLTPMTVSSVLACCLYVLDIQLPEICIKFLKFVDQGTSPLSMMIIGCSMAFAGRQHTKGAWRTYAVLGLRMTLVPVLCWLALRPLLGSDLIAGIFAVIYALPSAASTTMFCARYGKDQTLSSSAVLLATAASLITIPLLCRLLF